MSQLDLVGSFIVGGLVLFAIVAFQLQFDSIAQSNAFTESTQLTATEFGRVIEYDFNKIGYRVTSGSKIFSLGTSNISFLADLNNDGTIDSVLYYTNNSQQNLKLFRHTSLDNGNSFNMDIGSFTIQAYDSLGTATASASAVHSIKVDLLLQQNFNLTDKVERIGAYWSRRLYPRNL